MKTIEKLMAVVFLALALVISACATEEKADDMAADTTQVTEATAAETPTAATFDTQGANVVKISAPSMQCESCVNTIKTAVNSVEGAEDVSVDLESKTVFVKVGNNTPEMQGTLENAIAKSGYTAGSVECDKEAYAKLPDCCKMDGHKEGAATEKKKEL